MAVWWVWWRGTYLVVRREWLRSLKLLLEAREERGHLRNASVQQPVLLVQLREFILISAPDVRARDGRVLPEKRHRLDTNNTQSLRHVMVSSNYICDYKFVTYSDVGFV